MANESHKDPAGAAADSAAVREPIPRWKKIVIGVAAVILVTGLLLSAMGGGAGGADPGSSGPPTGGGATSLLDGGTGGPAPDGSGSGRASGSSDPWSAGLTRMGFSFFVGFAVGYLIRAFLRVALLFVGLILLVNSVLAYAGFVTVNWEAMEAAFNGYVGRLGEDFEQFSTMVTGRLPQAGLGALGLLTGIKKR